MHQSSQRRVVCGLAASGHRALDRVQNVPAWLWQPIPNNRCWSSTWTACVHVVHGRANKMWR
jgi:hypothetical protein